MIKNYNIGVAGDRSRTYFIVILSFCTLYKLYNHGLYNYPGIIYTP